MNSYQDSHDNVQDIRTLIKRQQELERELDSLKKSMLSMEQSNQEAISEVNERIDSVEREMVQLSQSIDNVVSSVERVQKTVNNVYKVVGKIEGKQDQTVEIQERFINQLWRAFFIILTIVTTGAGAVFALTK